MYLLVFVNIFAQTPDWSVNPNNYSYSMTVTGVLNIDQIELLQENDIVAAFVGDECRAVASPVFNSNVNRNIFYMMIYSNSTNETLTFKAYNSVSDEVIDLLNTFSFQINALIGNAETPYVWTNVELSNEAELLNYDIPLQVSQTVIGQNINITMPIETDLTNLIAEFSISEFANCFVGLTPQISGTSVNDFSNPIVYKVIAQNGDIKEWTVNVTKITNNSEFETEFVTIYPNPISDILTIKSENNIVKINILNSSGNIILQSYQNNINLSNLNSGIYFVEIFTIDNVFIRKIIKK